MTVYHPSISTAHTLSQYHTFLHGCCVPIICTADRAAALFLLPQVEKVYLLVRSKRQVSAQQRVERMLCSPLFNMLHHEVRKVRQCSACSGGLAHAADARLDATLLSLHTSTSCCRTMYHDS